LIKIFTALPTTNLHAVNWLEKYFVKNSIRDDVLEKLTRDHTHLFSKSYRLSKNGVTFDFYFYNKKTKKETPPRSIFVRGIVPKN
jgi:hypothetical protein